MSTTNYPKKLTLFYILISGLFLFFVTLIIAPFVNITTLADYFVISKVLFLSLAAIIGCINCMLLLPLFYKTHASLKRNAWTKKIMIGTILSIAISVLFSASLKTSLFGMYSAWESNLMMSVLYFVLLLSWITFFAVLRQSKLENIFFHLLMTLLILTTIVYGIGEYYYWKPSTGYISNSVFRISLGFKNPLFAAYFIGILWNFSFYTLVTQLSNVSRGALSLVKSAGFFIMYSGITLTLFLTFTRSAWIAAIISSVVILAVLVLQQRNVLPRLFHFRIAISVVMVIVVTGAIGYFFRNEISQRNSDLASESHNTLFTIARSLGKDDTPEAALDFYQQAATISSSEIRLREWSWGIRTWTGSVKNFLFGVGPDAGFFEMPKYRDPYFNNIPTDAATKPFYVRNMYLNTLMQIGVLASLGMIAGVFLVIQRLRRQKEFATLSLVIAFLAQGLFYYPTHLTIVLVLFGVAYWVSKQLPEDMLITRTPNHLEKALFFLLVGAILLWSTSLFRASTVIGIFNVLEYPPPLQEMEKQVTIPINNNVLKRYLVYYYPTSIQGSSLLEKLAKSNDPDDLRIVADAYYLRAKSNKSISDTFLSIDALQKLLTIDNTLPATWDNLGIRYLAIGELSEARASFLKAIELKEDYWYAYLHMGEVSRQQCNPQEALDWYKKAEQFVPSAETEIAEAEAEIAEPRPECQ